jgi:hypothetical protein
MKLSRKKVARAAGAMKASRFYRCPACGAEVDNQQREDVRFHHDHVLHPHWFRAASFSTGLLVRHRGKTQLYEQGRGQS